MKAFNLEEVLAGKPVVTRDGRDVEQFHIFKIDDPQPVYAVLGRDVHSFTKDGRFFSHVHESQFDLFMKEEKKVGWVNLYRVQSMVKDKGDWIRSTTVYETFELAKAGVGGGNYLATVQVEWEE